VELVEEAAVEVHEEESKISNKEPTARDSHTPPPYRRSEESERHSESEVDTSFDEFEPNVNSKPEIQGQDSKFELERRDSKPDFLRKDSKPELERRDSKPDVLRKDSRSEIERRDSKPELERRDSKTEVEKDDPELQSILHSTPASPPHANRPASVHNLPNSMPLTNSSPPQEPIASSPAASSPTAASPALPLAGAPSATPPPIASKVKEGWLETRDFMRWKLRWIVLYSDGRLIQCKSPKMEKISEFNVGGFFVKKKKTVTDKFIVFHPDAMFGLTNYHFRCKDKEEFNSWVNTIVQISRLNNHLMHNRNSIEPKDQRDSVVRDSKEESTGAGSGKYADGLKFAERSECPEGEFCELQKHDEYHRVNFAHAPHSSERPSSVPIAFSNHYNAFNQSLAPPSQASPQTGLHAPHAAKAQPSEAISAKILFKEYLEMKSMSAQFAFSSFVC
jgi:hypothetical protein